MPTANQQTVDYAENGVYRGMGYSERKRDEVASSPFPLSHENNRRATGMMPVLLLFSSSVVACSAMTVRWNDRIHSVSGT